MAVSSLSNHPPTWTIIIISKFQVLTEEDIKSWERFNFTDKGTT